MSRTRALVLGGGGVAGIAWETGVLCGLADAGVEVIDADLVVGTSAGATVAAQITSGMALDDLFARQLTPDDESGELAPPIEVASVAAMFIEALRHATTPTELRQAIGVAALATQTVEEPVRRAVLEHRLPVHTWPTGREVQITAVDVGTGEPRVFSPADTAVSIIDAVAASCAVPGIWPPVSIGGRRYMDGGVRSSTNADLASGCDVILVLSPSDDIPGIADPVVLAAKERLTLEQRLIVVRPDEASTEAIGVNVLDLATRAPAVAAGRLQGARIAADIGQFWNGAAAKPG